MSAIRYEQPLTDSPLIELDAVWDRLLSEGVAPSAQGRAWALGSLIHEIVVEQLEEARRVAGVEAPMDDPPEEALARDFSAGAPTLELWSGLYHRYLEPSQMQAGEIAARVGMPRRTLGRRLAAARRRLSKVLLDRERQAARSLAERPDLPLVDPSPAKPSPEADVVSEPEPTLQAPSEALLQAVRGTGERRLPVSPEALEGLATGNPTTLEEYRLSRVAAWSRPAYRVDARFVDLTLLVDRGEKAVDRWAAETEAFDDLGAVVEAVASPVFVLLGPPGSGKSTLLRRFELERAQAGLRGETDAVTLLVSLGRYWADRAGGELQAPGAWLASHWDRRYPDLPPFEQLLEAGQLVLLLDGLNEMPHADFDDYRNRILAWKRFLRETVAERPGLRVVFACRSLDYGAPLSSPDLRVPQVRVEPMSDAQVRAFLHRYAPAQAEDIWAGLQGAPWLELLRSPYLLTLLVEQAMVSGEAPVGRAALFTSFVRRAMQREIESDHPLFQPGPLVEEREYRRAVSGRRWASPWALPERGALIPGLTKLAYGMQSSYADGRASQVRVSFDAALELIDHPAAEDILRGGNALGMLDEHFGRDEILFFHQLLQEYFAARGMANDPEDAAARCRIELRAAAVAPDLESVIEGLETSEPLPALPSTGWEEIVLLAASMSGSPSDFVDCLAASNPPLAARAASQPEMAERVPASRLDALRDRLVALCGDEAIDLRARIEAGLALGELGDPRLERCEGPQGDDYQMPPWIAVPGGVYPIGDDAPIEWSFTGAKGQTISHVPRHEVEVSPFRIGRFPVTNAEWACFLAAGGYDDDRWWRSKDARAWRRGELANEGEKTNIRAWRKRFRDDALLLEQMVEDGRFANEEVAARWRGWMALDEEAFEVALIQHWKPRRETEPRFWRDGRFNHPSQPVVGVCWYEARAYAAWLSEQTGLELRLPTEAEWEAAARGGEGRAYAGGDTFDRLAANTLETHVMRTTPVGVFPGGRTPEGVDDLCGNVFEWTLSLYGDPAVEAFKTTYPYPYDPSDGREDPDAAASIRRVVKGGGWNNGHPIARGAFRDFNHPDYWNDNYGFRLVVSDGQSA